eukprot:GHVL01032353.1.p2 GENE.GHVL01032353.1~~GHVL01032353.1.p2  ORF type:complete len:189 (-),score=25.73 GHVL01032353.1:2073-2639(-)
MFKARTFWPDGVKLNSPGKIHSFNPDDVGENDSLVRRLFQHDAIVGIMIAENFLTIRVSDEREWPMIERICEFEIKRCVSENVKILPSECPSKIESDPSDNSEIVLDIKELLEFRIRPVINEDGGDVEFVRFEPETGTVFLHLTGACKDCPSSGATLYDGIQNMLSHFIPQVNEVKQVDEKGNVIEYE